jgi:hypothetical protein
MPTSNSSTRCSRWSRIPPGGCELAGAFALSEHRLQSRISHRPADPSGLRGVQ